MIEKSLSEYIEFEIIPQYKDFDKAHNLEHVQDVIRESLKLAAIYDTNPMMCLTIAAYHDLGLKHDRPQHHIHSGKILKEDANLTRWFSPEEIAVMKEAVEDHRASAKTPPRSIYGKIVAEADKNLEPIYTIRRAVQYGIAHHPDQGREWQYERVKEHMLEKYAEGGYLKLLLPQSTNADNLKRLQQIIKDETELRTIFDQLYTEEISL
ncbi:MAG: phosphohydrolase [Paludibacteraceae bacterium]|nr:phosphohydrolase [Paludibacteraceae bacterium]